MLEYMNLSGQSNILRYESGRDYIIVEFKSGRERFYKYTYASAGSVNVKEMKTLAEQGTGLNSYIMRNVKDNFESKW